MIRYKDNWEDAKKHYEAYWEKSSTDRCCLAISTPRPNGKITLAPHSVNVIELK